MSDAIGTQRLVPPIFLLIRWLWLAYCSIMNMKPQFVDHILFLWISNELLLCVHSWFLFVRLRVTSQSCRFVVFRFQHNTLWLARLLKWRCCSLYSDCLINSSFFCVVFMTTMKRKAVCFIFFLSSLEFMKISCTTKYRRWRSQPICGHFVPSLSFLLHSISFSFHFFHKIALNYDVDIVFHLYALLRLFWNLPNLIFINIYTVFFVVCIDWSIFALQPVCWFHDSCTYFMFACKLALLVFLVGARYILLPKQFKIFFSFDCWITTAFDLIFIHAYELFLCYACQRTSFAHSHRNSYTVIVSTRTFTFCFHLVFNLFSAHL